MHTDDFITITAGLRTLGGRRVWSLMISLFGDFAQARVHSIDGPQISAIMAAMLVKPEAARVALHRLRNDGWITSPKSGRISQHSLAPKGQKESAAASPRIYADPALSDRSWQLVLTEAACPELGDGMTALGFTALMPRVFVGPKQAQAPGGCIVLPTTEAPDWLRAQIEPQELSRNYAALLDTLSQLERVLPQPERLCFTQIAVLRCLIVHNWRRLVLKHPALPVPLVDPTGPSHQCHLLVSDLLGRFRLPRASENQQPSAAA